MSTPTIKKTSNRSNSRTRKQPVQSSTSKAPTLESMNELSADIEKSINQPRLSFLIRSANNELHDIELRTDETEMNIDPMNERYPADPANVTTENPALFTKASFQIEEEEESDMESELGTSIPFLLSRGLEEANQILRENCSCNHISIHSINKNKVFLIRNTPCIPDKPDSEVTEIDKEAMVEEEELPVIPQSVLDQHLRGVKRSREEYDELPANAKRVIKDFAEGKVPNFSLMDSETMQFCSDFL